MKTNQNIVICLKDIIKTFGIDVFTQHSKVNAIISDKMPGTDKAKDRYLLKLAIDHGFVTELSKTKANDLNKVCNKQKRILIDDNSIADDRAEEVIIWICQALDLKNPVFYQSSNSSSNTKSTQPVINVPATQQTGNNAPNLTPSNYGINTHNNPHRVKMRLSRGMIALIITCISIVVVAAGVFGIVTAVQNSKINAVESLIAELPDDENYYLDYQAEIVDAYAAYMELDEKLREKVENADKLLTVMDGLKVAEAYEQRQNMQFTKLESGGYSVKLKEGANSKISGELVVPGVYRQEPVVTIEDYAFENCRSITSIVVPDSITTIGVGAFKGCNNIKSMTLPFTGKSTDAVAHEAVFGYVFGYTTESSHSSDYGGSIEFINDKYGSTEQGVWQYTHKQNTNYGNSRKAYYYYIPTSIDNVVITNQSTIKDAAFNGCENIESITYKKTIDSFGQAAFQDCQNLLMFNSTTQGIVDLNGSFSDLGAYAFRNCSSISNVIFSDNVLVINNNAFDGCGQIEEVNLTTSVSFVGDYAFKNLKKITSIKVYNSTKTIGCGAFEGCNKVEKVEIPFTGRSNDANAYEAVFGYIFGYSTTNSHSSDYGGSTEFINEQYGSSEKGIWQYTLKQNTNYSSSRKSFYYYIPSTIKTVEITNQSAVKNAAFNGCSSIESIKYLKTIESFGIAGFQNCESLIYFNSETLGTADLTSEAQELGDCLFKNNKKITQIKLSEGLSVIGDYAFENTSITEMIIPNSVTVINVGVLKSCAKLHSIALPFIGKSANAASYEAVFGYIFGYSTKSSHSSDYGGSTAFINEQYGTFEQGIWQYTLKQNTNYSSSRKSFYYYIPTALTTVTITRQSSVPIAAFNGCTMLETITFEKGISSQGEAAFQNCSAVINK